MPNGAENSETAILERQTGTQKHKKNDKVKVEEGKYFTAHIDSGGYVVFDATPYFAAHPGVKTVNICCNISEAAECPQEKSGGGTVVIGG
jgi:hypothetical protein